MLVVGLKESVDEVHNLLRRHEDLENKLQVQQKRIDEFCISSNKLIITEHPEAD